MVGLGAVTIGMAADIPLVVVCVVVVTGAIFDTADVSLPAVDNTLFNVLLGLAAVELPVVVEIVGIVGNVSIGRFVIKTDETEGVCTLGMAGAATLAGLTVTGETTGRGAEAVVMTGVEVVVVTDVEVLDETGVEVLDETGVEVLDETGVEVLDETDVEVLVAFVALVAFVEVAAESPDNSTVLALLVRSVLVGNAVDPLLVASLLADGLLDAVEVELTSVLLTVAVGDSMVVTLEAADADEAEEVVAPDD